MGKLESIKPGSADRVRKHRAEMRAKGYRLKQVWVPDRNSPAFRKETQRAVGIINRFERDHPDDVRWMDEAIARAWDDMPD